MLRLVALLQQAAHIVFFTGAGMSTESGLPDFRGVNGLWSEPEPIDLLSYHAWHERPAQFYTFFRSVLVPWAHAQPHQGHQAIARLEQLGHRVTVITQNIDSLHQKAGSTHVIELHGHLRNIRCAMCGNKEPLAALGQSGIPLCTLCGGTLKPEVVLFGDPLPGEAFAEAEAAISAANLLCVVGTSLSVAPACRLVEKQQPGVPLVVINHTATYIDHQAQLVFRQSVGQVLHNAVTALG